jgi:hypothetical protein
VNTPIVTSVRSHISHNTHDSNALPAYVANITDISFDSINKVEFTLSHYGLPEPDFGERRTNRVRYIVIGIGILMMIIGAWRMIQERRKRF